MRLLLVAILVLSCFLLQSTYASSTESAFDVDQLQQQTSLNSVTRFLVDESGEATIQDIMATVPSEWQINSEGKENFGQSLQPQWFHVHLRGLRDTQKRLFFEVAYAHLDILDVFFVYEGAVQATYLVGDTRPFNQRPIKHRNFLFSLQDIPANQLDIFLKVKTGGPIDVPLQLMDQAGYENQERKDFLRYGGYFGIMLLMLFYNTAILLVVRDLSYLFYILYIAATASLQFTLNGLGFQYIWPSFAGFNNIAVLILSCLMPFTAIAFVWRFVGLHTNGTILEKIIAKSLIACFVAVLIGSFYLPYMLVLKTIHVLAFLSICLGFYIGVRYWFKGFKSARIFAIAWFSYLVFIAIYILQIRGFIEPTIISQHALEIGSVVELVLLSLAFADRLNEEKELRLEAQLQLNQDLDQLVHQRTEELERVNQKLQEISITDSLTGAANRRHFDHIFAKEYQRAYREKLSVALIMLDIDHFKSINDNYGHVFGDLCLQHITAIIQSKIRRPPDLLARYGGEEFVILLPNTDSDGAKTVAENIRQAIENYSVTSENHADVRLTASLGVCTCIPNNQGDAERMTQKADKLLYKAKENGRNRVMAQ